MDIIEEQDREIKGNSDGSVHEAQDTPDYEGCEGTNENLTSIEIS